MQQNSTVHFQANLGQKFGSFLPKTSSFKLNAVRLSILHPTDGAFKAEGTYGSVHPERMKTEGGSDKC